MVRPGRGENHGGKAKELLGGFKKMIETKLGNTKVKGFTLELVGDFAVAECRERNTAVVR